MEKVRVGILGVSWWTDVIYPGFSSAPNVEIVAIAGRTAEKARDFAKVHGIADWSGEYLDIIHSRDIDAVYIGVPNHLHDEMAIASLANGKHVLQEKPMALTSERAIAQKIIAQSKRRVLMVNQELRLTDGLMDLREFAINRIGPLRKVLISLTLAPSQWSGWRADPHLSGGSLFEMAIHELDLARFLWDRNPVRIQAMGDDRPGHDMTVLIDFGGGDMAVVDVCWRSIGFRLRVECCGERGHVVREAHLPFGPGRQVVVTADGEETSHLDISAQGERTFRRVMETFCDAILKKQKPPVTGDDGVWAVKMAEASRRSLRTGDTIGFTKGT